MPSGEINVKIKGNSSSAQKALKSTDKALKNTGKTAKSTNSVLKNFKSNWVGITATVGLAVVQMKASIQAFAKQEESDLQLQKSLELTGDATKETLDAFKEMADEIQRLTVVGDEDTQMLQSLALNMGVTADEVEKATKGSIGLAASFEKAGLSQETAMKGVALAFQGNFSQLERYIPALRETKDETLKMTILENEMAKGFEMAKSKTETAAGAMKQMTNAVGDAQESIGGALVPVLLPMVKAIKEGAEGFESLPGPVKSASVAIAGLGVALAVAIKLFGMSVSSAGALGIGLLALAGAYKLVKMAINAGAKAARGWNEVANSDELEKAKGDLEGYKTELQKTGMTYINSKDALVDYLNEQTLMNDGLRESGSLLRQGKITQEEYAQSWETAKEKTLEQNEALITVVDKIANTTEAINAFEESSKINAELQTARSQKSVEDETMKIDKLLAENQRMITGKLAQDKKETKTKKKIKKKTDKEELTAAQKKEKSFQTMFKDTAAIKDAMISSGVSSVIDAAAQETATLGSVAAAGIRAVAESLSNQMKIRSIAAFATGNFVVGASTAAAAIGIKALGNKVASGIEGKKSYREGGIIDEPVIGVGQRTGASYEIGEAGPERVSPVDQDDSGGGGGMTFYVENLTIQPNTLNETEDEILDFIANKQRR